MTTAEASVTRRVDPVDERLLALLRADSRQPVSELATQAHISRANAYARLERLRAGGVIRRFTIDVDPEAVGAGLPAFINVRIRQHSWKSFRDRVMQLPSVEHVALVAGEFDVILLVRTQHVQTLRTVILEQLQTMPEVLATHTTFILDEATP